MKPDAPLESQVVARILRRLRTLPGLVVRKRHGTAMGVAGDPDLTGCYQGRHFEFEVKRPGGQPTKLQLARIDEWRQAGAVTAVVRSPEEAMAALGIGDRG